MSDWVTDQLMKELRKRIRTIKIRTEYGPDIDINDPLQPGPPNPYLMKLKPEITIDIKGYGPLTMAPYGKPGPTKWAGYSQAARKGGEALSIITLGTLVYKAFKTFKG